MIKDYQNKEVLAEMKRQVNAAAKISDREARITFVLIHMISGYHILAEQCTKPDGENNLFRFISWCLSRFAEELETASNEEFTNPIELLQERSRYPSARTHPLPSLLDTQQLENAIRTWR